MLGGGREGGSRLWGFGGSTAIFLWERYTATFIYWERCAPRYVCGKVKIVHPRSFLRELYDTIAITLAEWFALVVI